MIGMYLMHTLDDFFRFSRSLDVIDNVNTPDYEHAFFDFNLSRHISG